MQTTQLKSPYTPYMIGISIIATTPLTLHDSQTIESDVFLNIP
jgi:hypothetical protein